MANSDAPAGAAARLVPATSTLPKPVSPPVRALKGESLPLGHLRDQALMTRVHAKAGGFQNRNAEERLLMLAGEHHCAP